MEIIHICPDAKFIDAAWDAFETLVPGGNRYFIQGEAKELKYINNVDVIFTGRQPWKNENFCKLLKNAPCVILHSLSDTHVKLVNAKSLKGTKFVWVGFGFDYYDFVVSLKADLYMPRTSETVASLNKSINQFSLQRLKIKFSGMFRKALRRQAVKKISFFCPVLESEYELVRSSFRDSASFPKLALYNYGTNAKLFDEIAIKGNAILGENILLGNSANPTNNHIEIIDMLSRLNLGDRDVIVPLSYGYGNNDYIRHICSFGQEKLGDKFKPITDFLPYREYVDLLNSCRIVLMNHKRQQALGNIQMQIARGATVFLRRENPVYSWYQEMGVEVMDIEKLSECYSVNDIRLGATSIQSNRKIIIKRFGWNEHLDKVKKFIDLVSVGVI